jgi:hypothetical protein
VREAGGQVTRVDGSPIDCFREDSIATNGHLQPLMLAAFRQKPGA